MATEVDIDYSQGGKSGLHNRGRRAELTGLIIVMEPLTPINGYFHQIHCSFYSDKPFLKVSAVCCPIMATSGVCSHLTWPCRCVDSVPVQEASSASDEAEVASGSLDFPVLRNTKDHGASCTLHFSLPV